MPYTLPLAFALALLLFIAGCQNSLRNIAKATAGQLDPPNVSAREETIATNGAPPAAPLATNSPTATPTSFATGEPLVEPTREEAFQQVLTDLQAIGREDPAAQQRLLAQLGTADPAHWAPLVQRTRSTMRYQQQLAAQQKQSDVMQASTEQSSPSPPHGHEREARVLNLSDATPEANTGAHAPPASGEPQPYRPSAGGDYLMDNQTDNQTMRDPAVQPTTAAMVFPGPANPEQAPYAVSLHGGSRPPAAGATSNDPLEHAIEGFSQRLAQHPQSVAEAYDHVRLRLLQLAAGDLDRAATPPPGLTANEQQYWSNQLLAIGTLLDNQTHPEARRRAAASGLHLKQASSALEQLGSLTVSNLEFCEEVYGFGAYKPLRSARFRPGQEVKVYAEVENFKSVDTAQGLHTSLATSYRVLDQYGGQVEGGEVPVVNDYCATRRRDFHIQYGITLPKGIYPGKYVLELTLTDQLGDKIGHGLLDFEIVDGDRPQP